MTASISLPGKCTPLLTARLIRGATWTSSFSGPHYLKQHTRMLARMFRYDNRHTRELREPCLRLFPLIEEQTNLFTQVSPETLRIVPVLTRIAGYQEQWVRAPESWRSDGQASPKQQLRSLTDHLFKQYTIPDFCDSAWLVEGALRNIERDWYCHLAKGNNIRKFRDWKPVLTKRAAHEFLNAPADFTIREAVRYGQVKAIWHDEAEVLAICGNRRLGTYFSGDPVWLPFLELAKQQSISDRDFSLQQLELVCDFLWLKISKTGGVGFRLKGRSWEELLHSARNHFGALASRSPNSEHREFHFDALDSPLWQADVREKLVRMEENSWVGLAGMQPFDLNYKGWQWQMRELTSQYELNREADDMNHCVWSYSESCRNGYCAIFSLWSRPLSSDNGRWDREITIEVRTKNRRISQIRAWQNRRPHASAQAVIRQWADANELQIASWAW